MFRRNKTEFEALVDRVDSVWDGELDPEHILTIENSVAARQEELLDQGRRLEAKIKAALESGDTDEIDRDTDAFRRTQFEYEALEKSRKRLYSKRQQRTIWKGMRAQLGERPARFLEYLILVLICVVLSILFFEMIFADQLSRELIIRLYVIDFCACLVFIAEFALRYRHAEDKRWFWRNNWIDLISCIPFPPPVLIASLGTADVTTLARLARLFRLLRLLRAVRIVALMWSGLERLDRVADVQMIKRALIVSAVLLFAGGALIHFSESVDRPAAVEAGQLQQVADSGDDVIYADDYTFTLWWTFNTIATGGFGDLYKPVTPFAQAVTALLIICGFVVLGVFIATMSAAFKGEDTDELRRNQRLLVDALQDLQQTLAATQSEVRALRAGSEQ